MGGPCTGYERYGARAHFNLEGELQSIFWSAGNVSWCAAECAGT